MNNLDFINFDAMGLIMLVIVITVLIIAVIFTMRAIFSIATIVKNLKVQTKLLSEIAKAQGVSNEVIEAVKKEVQ